jgi:hypothetical protein
MTHLFPIPERKDAHARPTSNVVPHPRHRVRRLYDAQSPTSRANHPVYNDYDLHLVNDFDDNHLDDDRSRTRGANVTPHDRTSSAVDGGLPTGDRGTRSQALRPVRSGRGGLVRWDRLARVELPTRRGESDGMQRPESDGLAFTRGPVRHPRTGLAYVMDGSRRQLGRCGIAVCVLGGIALAALIDRNV